MSKTLGQYKILFDGLNIHEELNFFLKEKLKFNDQDTLINNERILTKHQQNLIEQDMSPFGFVDDGIPDHEKPEVDEYGTVWHPVVRKGN